MRNQTTPARNPFSPNPLSAAIDYRLAGKEKRNAT